ncbi:hypothetical protein BDU57DRAFT_320827 [Ampelomyces quisqualis]|uniref:Uncharacterized protein n=1 Tax=Ampelomyces quisqualis TaxID=50730 RepID=A0A6A5QEB6_AMPQU|nr:hypothetical protein BDU57DRAFT_320827 [Ampelomyces quisqualis]
MSLALTTPTTSIATLRVTLLCTSSLSWLTYLPDFDVPASRRHPQPAPDWPNRHRPSPSISLSLGSKLTHSKPPPRYRSSQKRRQVEALTPAVRSIPDKSSRTLGASRRRS